MTVSPKHSLDGVRTKARNSHDPEWELLPPVLFSLPNLRPRTAGRTTPAASVETEKTEALERSELARDIKSPQNLWVDAAKPESPSPTAAKMDASPTPLSSTLFVHDTVTQASVETIVSPYQPSSPTNLPPTDAAPATNFDRPAASTERMDPAHFVSREGAAQPPRPPRNRHWIDQISSHSIVLVMLVIVLGIAFVASRQKTPDATASPEPSPTDAAPQAMNQAAVANHNHEIVGPELEVTVPQRKGDFLPLMPPEDVVPPSSEIPFLASDSAAGSSSPVVSSAQPVSHAGTQTPDAYTPQPNVVAPPQYQLSNTPRQIDDWQR